MTYTDKLKRKYLN